MVVGSLHCVPLSIVFFDMEDSVSKDPWFEEDWEEAKRYGAEGDDTKEQQERRGISRRTCLKVLGIGALGTALGYQQWQIQELKNAQHQDGVPEVVRKVAPSTAIVARSRMNADGKTYDGGGSGFFIRDASGEAHLLTNTHVIWPQGFQRETDDHGECLIAPFGAQGEFSAKVAQLPDGREATAPSLFHDITMLEVPPEVSVPRLLGLKLRNLQSRPLNPGEKVVIVGSPFALEGSVTTGVVSAVQRSGAMGSPTIPFIQIDAAAHPGSSGSPVVDMRGEIVGVVSAVYPFNGSYAENVVFALRSDALEAVLREWGIEV